MAWNEWFPIDSIKFYFSHTVESVVLILLFAGVELLIGYVLNDGIIKIIFSYAKTISVIIILAYWLFGMCRYIWSDIKGGIDGHKNHIFA